jgi:hypothetical protein
LCLPIFEYPSAWNWWTNVSAVGSIIEYMFESLPADVATLRGLDEAALIDTVAGWARASAASDAMKYATIAEFERRRCTDEHPNWACDDWDAAAAEIAARRSIPDTAARPVKWTWRSCCAIASRRWARCFWRANSTPAGSG